MNTVDNDAVRLLRTLLALVGVALLLACLTAPLIFNGLIALGRAVPAFEGLRDLHFEPVIARMLLIYLLLGFYPAVRWAGVRSPAAVGLVRGLPWRRELLMGWGVGLLSVGLLLVWAWAAGAYVWAPDSWDRVAVRVIGYLVGGLLVGYIEEVFFRGALYGALRRVAGLLPAAVLVSLFFALVHFLSPEHPEGIVHGHWYSGFALIPHVLYRTEDLNHYVPFAFNLFLMGWVLSAFYERQGHLYGVIGLHAGWVWLLQGSRSFFERDPLVLPWLFGASANMGRSWVATAMLGLLLVWALVPWPPRRRRPKNDLQIDMRSGSG